MDAGSIVLLFLIGGFVLLVRWLHLRRRHGFDSSARDVAPEPDTVSERPPDTVGGPAVPRSRRDLPTHAPHPMAATLLLVVVGAGLVVLDFDINRIPLIPDGLGYGLLAVAGIRLVTVERHLVGTSLKRAGAGLTVVATISAVDWLAILAGWRPAPDAATGAVAWFDAVLLLATVSVGVLLLVPLSRWFTERDLHQAAQRLRFGAQALALTWGTFALLAVVATTVPQSQDRAAARLETPLAIPVVLVMFAALGYCAWALLKAQTDLRRQTPQAVV